MRRRERCARGLWVELFVLFLVLVPVGLDAQVINEVLADNESEPPADVEDGHPDLVEIFNDTDRAIELGRPRLAESYYLARVLAAQDPPVFERATAWPFPPGRSTLAPNGHLTVFCDDNEVQGTCELHAAFSIASDGSESIVLWGPEVDGVRPVVDRVFLPPLPRDVSWGRFPDGSGGHNLPIEAHFEHFEFYPPGNSSFGSCAPVSGICLVAGESRRHCGGASNPEPQPEWNLPPRVTLVSALDDNPEERQPVRVTVAVWDDAIPTPDDIKRAELIYRFALSAGPIGRELATSLELDAAAGPGGVVSGAAEGRPLELSTHWRVTINSPLAGLWVEFYVRVEDVEGGSSTWPPDLCHLLAEYGEGVGPCDRELGFEANGCVRDREDSFWCECVRSAGGDVTCEEVEEHERRCADVDDGDVCEVTRRFAERYVACNVRRSYCVACRPRPELAGLVINEVVPAQDGVLTDLTEPPCEVLEAGECPRGFERCLERGESPDCCRRNEGFLELFNTSSSPVDVGGCWLADGRFGPRRWRFPDGAVIPASTRVIVWLDGDGSQCPDPSRPVAERPCFWRCPDPNSVSMAFDPPEFHASFSIDASGDQIFLFDREANGFGLIDRFDFRDPSRFCGFREEIGPDGRPTSDVRPNQAVALLPDGARDGQLVIVDTPTPMAPNSVGCQLFRRGDATGEGSADIADAITILNYLFLSGVGLGAQCLDAADSDDSGQVDLTDAIAILLFNFLGGAPPPDPGPIACGVDPTEDGLSPCVYSPEACRR